MLTILQHLRTHSYVVGDSISCIESARITCHNDQFLNEVMQCQKQLTLPGICIKLIV